MIDSLEQREKQANQALATLADELNGCGGPGPAVMERIKCAVRHEMNEQWLARQPEPERRPDLLADVQADVRREIARQQGWARGMRSSHHALSGFGAHSRWVAALAAAAMMAICVGVVRQVGYLGVQTGTSGGNAMVNSAPVDLFVEAAQATFANDEFSAEVLKEVQSIESQLAGAKSNSQGTTLEDLSGALQEVLDGSGSQGATMGQPAISGGVSA